MDSRIFLYHDGALGDVLLSLPAIHAINIESSFLHLAAGSNPARLLKTAGFADEISDAGSMFYATLYTDEPGEELKAFLSHFNRAFVFTKETNSGLASRIRHAIPETLTINTIPHDQTKKHIPDFRLEQVPDCFSGHPSPVRLSVPGQNIQGAEALLLQNGYDQRAPLIAIHPGSGGRKKNWHIERFFELADRFLSEHNCFVVFISGPDESDRTRHKIDGFVIKRKTTAMHLKDADLITVAALMQTSSLYIGNDSGITHLASSVNDRVIALYGPTDPRLWAPFNHNIRIISSPKECTPCGEEMHACESTDCLSGISVSTVYNEAVSMLSGLPISKKSQHKNS